MSRGPLRTRSEPALGHMDRAVSYDEAPLGRGELGDRLPLFAAVTALGVVGAVLPGGRIDGLVMVWSLALLAAVGLALMLVPWDRLPRWAAVVPPVVYLGFVGLLLLAQGGVASGSFPLVLVAVTWVAFFHRRWESAVVVVALIVMLAGMSVAEHIPGVVIVRRLALWGAVTAGLSAAAHQLRRRLQGAMGELEELLRQARTLRAAAEALTQLHRPADVVVAATKIAADLASPVGAGRRATYFRVEGGWVTIEAQPDEAGHSILDSGFALDEHPPLLRVVETGEAVNANFEDEQFGPELRAAVQSAGVTHGACVPIAVGGRLVGALAVGGRGQPIGPQLFDQLIALGHIVELALASAIGHQEVAALAATDELTGLANRRGYQQAIAMRPSRRPFAVISGDLDGLKSVNDELGHLAGDAMLAQVGRAIRSALRQGDVAARLGGDEFAVLLHDADEGAAQRVADRILRSVDASVISGVPARVSLGIATGGPDTDPGEVLRRADLAMYAAKANGGMRWVLADEPAWASSTLPLRRGVAPPATIVPA